MNAENIRDAEQRRLTWRCRRGMLELDIVLQRFLAQHFSDLTRDELRALDAMLELPDNAFWEVLQMNNVLNQRSKNKAQQSIINKIHGLQAA